MTGSASTSPANIAAGPSSTHSTASTNAGVVNTNDYTFTKKEWLFLANAYLDLGTWWCITPFIGAGVGVANLTIANYPRQQHHRGRRRLGQGQHRDQFCLGAACRRLL